jgi:hypothetical protein
MAIVFSPPGNKGEWAGKFERCTGLCVLEKKSVDETKVKPTTPKNSKDDRSPIGVSREIPVQQKRIQQKILRKKK